MTFEYRHARVAMNDYTCDFNKFNDCGLEQSVNDIKDWSALSASTSADNVNRSPIDHTSNSDSGQCCLC